MSTRSDDQQGATPPPRDPETVVYPCKRNGRVMLVEAHEGGTWIADLRGNVVIPEDEWR